ncbi:MAG: hypothetical protein QQN63_12795 [Nitrosopumilus sp.]
MKLLGFHLGFTDKWNNSYFFIGFGPRWRKVWAWLTSPFRKKTPKHVPDRMEVAFDKALHEMADLPKEIQKTEGKDGWITYAEHKKLFRTRSQAKWRSTDDNRLP